MRLVLVCTDGVRQLDSGVFLPNVFGWAGAPWVIIVFIVVCYLLPAWNEQRKQVGVLRF